MRILLVVLGVVALLFLSFIGIAFFLPNRFELKRSIVIHEPIEKVYPLVSDLRNWERWAPWVYDDASIEVSYEPTYRGVGARYNWSSSSSGNGSMEIVEEKAPYSIEFELWFEGWNAPSVSHFEFKEVANGGTEVIWVFSGELGSDPIQRWSGLFLDRMVGGMFESGLESIRIVAEADKQDEAA